MRKKSSQYFDYLVEVEAFSLSYMLALHGSSHLKHPCYYEEFLHPTIQGKVIHPKITAPIQTEIILICNRSLDRYLSDELHAGMESPTGLGRARNRKGVFEITLSASYKAMGFLTPALCSRNIKYLSLHAIKNKRDLIVLSYHFSNQFDQDNYPEDT